MKGKIEISRVKAQEALALAAMNLNSPSGIRRVLAAKLHKYLSKLLTPRLGRS